MYRSATIAHLWLGARIVMSFFNHKYFIYESLSIDMELERVVFEHVSG